MKPLFRIALLLVFVFAGIKINGATIGGITFQDNAFADVVLSATPGVTPGLSGGTVEGNITDKSELTYIQIPSPENYIELGFTDNAIVNGPGADLALFELFVIQDIFRVSLSVGGTFQVYQSTFWGLVQGVELNLALVDLSDFGVLPGEVINRIVVSTPNFVNFPLAAAINNGPAVGAPDSGSTAGLLGVALAGTACARRFGSLRHSKGPQ